MRETAVETDMTAVERAMDGPLMGFLLLGRADRSYCSPAGEPGRKHTGSSSRKLGLSGQCECRSGGRISL